MSQNNLVSVIITTFNAEKYINNTLLSVINQTYKLWEIIIIDDCSKDSTWELLKNFNSSYQNKTIQHFISKTTTGST